MKLCFSLENVQTVLTLLNFQGNPVGMGIFHPVYGASGRDIGILCAITLGELPNMKFVALTLRPSCMQLSIAIDHPVMPI